MDKEQKDIITYTLKCGCACAIVLMLFGVGFTVLFIAVLEWLNL